MPRLIDIYNGNPGCNQMLIETCFGFLLDLSLWDDSKLQPELEISRNLNIVSKKQRTLKKTKKKKPSSC